MNEAALRLGRSRAFRILPTRYFHVVFTLPEALRVIVRYNREAPFGGAQQVYAYLGRCTHRVGISNARIRSIDERGVTFATKGGRECTLARVEFLRRFVDHGLPSASRRRSSGRGASDDGSSCRANWP